MAEDPSPVPAAGRTRPAGRRAAASSGPEGLGAADLVDALGPEGPTPRYLQLAGALRDFVARGVFRPGDALPSERDLATMSGLARVTVRRAVDELRREGILSRRHGSGTYVARRIEQPLSVLTGFCEDMRTRGSRPSSHLVSTAVARPTSAEVLALGIGPDERVTRLRRLRMADGEPLAIETAVVPAAILPSPDLVRDSLYAALAERGFRPAHGVQRLHAALASPEEAELLAVPAGSAILRIERRAFLANGRPVEFNCSAYRGDRYDFVATLRAMDGAGDGAAPNGPGR